MMSNTTERGNAFRDSVARLLRAAGFEADTEVHIDFKNVDVGALYSRDDIAGRQRYAFETKDYSGSLPKSECTEFVHEYETLVRNGSIDHAWLISKGQISPQGKNVFETAGSNVKGMTLAELQRRLLLLDPYMQTLVSDYKRRQLEKYYIRPETPDGSDLETEVRNWISELQAPPLFVLGPYGKGKSTFAMHLAASMAIEALDDPALRIPILVRLGEIADEQSIDGLFGKVFASQNRAVNYHFDTFRALNEAGRFLIIYDGFDEMKYGLTPTKFQNVLNELMRLDEGDARILVLGRDTAFHSELEFKAVVDGMQITSAGREVPTPGRRPYRHTEIRGFSKDEAKEYVKKYLPVRAADEKNGAATDRNWIASRVQELIGGQFDYLLERPVHAQMLCEIAVHPVQLKPNMSVYELFDTFVHYLLHREFEKKGRDRTFTVNVRRSFNANLAWWLWERGGASTTTLADIPQSICNKVAKEVSHSLSESELRRELIQGCLIEKGANTIYFHRSLQEFLVAEYLIETDLLKNDASISNWFMSVTSHVTPEVIEFITAGVAVSQERRDRALDWLSNMASATGDRVPIEGFSLFLQLASELKARVNDPNESPWFMWLTFFLHSGANNFSYRGRNTFPVLTDLVLGAKGSSNEAQAAILYIAMRTMFHGEFKNLDEVAKVFAAMIPVKRLKAAVENARQKKSERQIIQYDKNFMFWCLLSSLHVEISNDSTLAVKFDFSKIHHETLRIVNEGFAGEEFEQVFNISLPVQTIYRALTALGANVSEKDIDGIRPFFNNPEIRKLIVPLEIEHRTAISTPSRAIKKPERETLRAK